MDWISLLGNFGIGGAVGALIGAVAAAQKAKGKLDNLSIAIKQIAPEYRRQIDREFDAFRTSFDQLRGSLDLLRKSFQR